LELRSVRTLTEKLQRSRLALYKPYSKQREFHAAGAKHRERLFMAGNQLGKTLAGSMEVAMHATGLYAKDWDGRRFDRANAGWAAGETGEAVRDSVQKLLLGRVGSEGTGAIPASSLDEVMSARGVSGLADTIFVKHVSGERSQITLKSYEKGREKWQAETLDWVWFDEEPDEDIYLEGLTRTNATGGLVFMTFTPLKGMSTVVKRFLLEPSPDRHVTTMTIDDAEHFTPEQKAKIIASYPAHEMEARTKGTPILGSGRVFPIAETMIQEPAQVIPDHWPRICGMDIGIDHPTAAAWVAWDRDSDTVHVYDAYRARDGLIPIHASAIRSRGDWIPVSWPHDAHKRDGASTGEQYAALYAKEGCNVLPVHAQTEENGNSTEPALADMLTRMQTGRFKVAAHLNDWWEEFRLYHRKNGLVVKEQDDLMSATRYAVMMLRFAETNVKRKPKEVTDRGHSQGWMG
jgi:phage terminase large subunit-like protein